MGRNNGHNRIHYIRAKRGLTLEELASEVGMTASALSKIERGETARPHKLTRRSLARVLEVDEDKLFGPATKR